MVAVDQRLIYKRELLAGDLVHIRSGILEVKDRTIKFFHEMINSDTNELAASSTLVGVHLDTVARKATLFPDEIVIKVKEMLGK